MKTVTLSPIVAVTLARLDADRTAQPKTRLVGHSPEGALAGPYLTQAEALEDTETGKRTALSAEPCDACFAHVLCPDCKRIEEQEAKRDAYKDALAERD